MSNIDISKNPEFSLQMEAIEKTTPVNDDEMNSRYLRMLENEAFLYKYKSERSIRKETVLLASAWTGETAPYCCTVLLEEAAEHNNIEILPSSNLTVEQYEQMTEAGILGGTQTTGSVTLLAYGDKPVIDLPLVILVRGD